MQKQTVLILIILLALMCCVIISVWDVFQKTWELDFSHRGDRIITVTDPENDRHERAHHKCSRGECVILPTQNRYEIENIDPRQLAWAHAQHEQHIQQCGNCDDLPKFNPDLYNDPKYEPYNNCYFYAFSDLNKTRKTKPQPGTYFHHLPKLEKHELDCPNIMSRVLIDHPGVKIMENPDDPAPCGHYKVALLMSKGEDYHFCRLDSNFYWSHKPGRAPVQNIDSSGAYITDPLKADWDYSKQGGVHYNQVCAVFCVPNETDQIYEDESHHAPSKWTSDLPLDYIPPN